MRAILLALLSLSLHAQNNAVPPSASQNIIKRSFAKWTPKLVKQPGPRQQWVTKPESNPSPCSIPLLNATPQVKGTMRIIPPPKIESNMPQLKMPAPPCQH